MKLFRYRRPSLNTLLGITGAKRRLRREIGVSQLEAWTKPSRIRQKVKRKLGLYSPATRFLRQAAKGNYPRFLGMKKSKK